MKALDVILSATVKATMESHLHTCKGEWCDCSFCEAQRDKLAVANTLANGGKSTSPMVAEISHALVIAGIKPQIQSELERIEAKPSSYRPSRSKVQLPTESYAQFLERQREYRMDKREAMRLMRAKRLARATRETEQILADNAKCIADMHAHASGHLIDPAIQSAQRYLGVKGHEPMVFKHVSSVAVLNKLDAANMAVLMHRIGKRERADIVATLCTRFSAGEAGKYSNGKPPSRARRDKTLTEQDFAKTHTNEYVYNHMLRHGLTSKSEPLNHIRPLSDLQRTKSLLRFIPSSLEVYTTQERLTPKRALMTITPKGSEPLAVYPSVLHEYQRQFVACSTFNVATSKASKPREVKPDLTRFSVVSKPLGVIMLPDGSCRSSYSRVVVPAILRSKPNDNPLSSTACVQPIYSYPRLAYCYQNV